MNEVIEDRAGGIGGRGGVYLRRRYMVLFYSLLLTMVAVPASGVLGMTPLSLNYSWLPICLLR